MLLDDIMKEYVDKNKNDFDNFMNPRTLKRYVDQNKLCTLFVSQMKKKFWKPDKFKISR